MSQRTNRIVASQDRSSWSSRAQLKRGLPQSVRWKPIISPLQILHGLTQGGAKRAKEGGLVLGLAVDDREWGELENGDLVLSGAGEGRAEGIGAGPGEFVEEGGVVALERKEVGAATGGGADGRIVPAVELGEGGVDPARGDFDAVGTDDGDLFEAVVKGGREGALEARTEVAAALRAEIGEAGIEEDLRVVDDLRENPEFDGIVGVIGGKAEADPAIDEPAELAEKDADEGTVDPGRISRSERSGEPGILDPAGQRFGEKDEQEAGHRRGTLHPASPSGKHEFPKGNVGAPAAFGEESAAVRRSPRRRTKGEDQGGGPRGRTKGEDQQDPGGTRIHHIGNVIDMMYWPGPGIGDLVRDPDWRMRR